MPIVTLETGQKLTFPEGTTSDQINFAVDEFVTKNGISPQKAPAQQAPAALQQAAQEPQSTALRNQQAVGNFARGIPQGLGNVAIGGVQAATDVGEKAAQLIEKLYFGDNLQMNTFGNRLAEQAKIRKEQQAQLPMSERAGIFVGEVAPTIAVGAGTGVRVTQALSQGGKLAKFAAPIAGIATSGGIGGATSSALSMQKEAGLGNRALETAKGGGAGFLFGAGLGVGGKLVGAIGNAGAKLGQDIINGFKARPAEAIAGFTNKPIETLDAVGSAIKDKSSAIYKAMQESNSTLTPQATKKVFSGIDSALSESGIMNKRLHGDTLGIVSDLKKVAKEKSGNVSIEELDQYRQLLGDVVKKNTDVGGKLNADAFKANIAINKLDDVVENLKPELISGGKESVNLLNQARGEWQRYRKFDAITSIVKKADGDPNRIKTLMQNFVNNPKNLRGFSDAEKSALKNASRNSTGEGLLKAVGKFGFDLGSGRNIGNAALPVGSILVGGGTGGMLATVGTVARQAQKLSARGKVEDVLKLIQGQEPQVASKAIQRLSPKTRDFVLTNLLTQSSMRGNNDAQAAETENMTEKQIRNQLIQRQQQEPVLMSGINPQAEAQKIKKRYYR
jgi:hypothetical protein